MNSKRKKKLILSDWKARNNKVFSNLDIDPRDTLKLAETESLLWSEAQNSLAQEIDRSRLQVTPIVPTILDGVLRMVHGKSMIIFRTWMV